MAEYFLKKMQFNNAYLRQTRIAADTSNVPLISNIVTMENRKQNSAEPVG